MDIYSFVNSKDMQNYLRRIRYQFSAPEAAFIIYQCKGRTLDEKMAAWQEIIETMPDCSIPERLNLMKIDSFHDVLADYMNLQRQKAQDFYDSDGYIYSLLYHEPPEKCGISDGWYEEDDEYFADYAACLEYCRKEEEIVSGNVDRILIRKRRLHSADSLAESERTDKPSGGQLLLSQQFDILEAEQIFNCDNNGGSSYAADLDLIFEGMCFDFPTPFRRGDLLIGHREIDTGPAFPFVLSYLVTWTSKEFQNRGFSFCECPWRKGWEAWDRHCAHLLRDGDTTDMDEIGTYVHQGQLYRDNIGVISTDLEYYPGPLERDERQLQEVSLYEKGEMPVDQLINRCVSIRQESIFENAKWDWNTFDTKA
ncbi:MAG: hypothetical protein LUF32_08355 [Clostridiales bacterium]|nr:hypothetical protein [Clostridiales bacterium]